MSRLLLVTLLGLSIAVGLTVGAVAWRMLSFAPVTPDLGAADPAIGYAFYQGLDDVLATGDRAALDRSVSNGFVDHRDGVDRSTGELVDELTAFRAAFPGTKLTVLEIQGTPGTLIASMGPMQLAGATVAGVPLRSQPIPSGYEVLRVRSGKVTERWSAPLPQLSAATFDDAAFGMSAGSSSSVRLEELTIPKDGNFSWRSSTQNVVMVETGQIRIDSAGDSSLSQPERQIDRLQEGQALLFVTGNRMTLRNEGPALARVLLFSISIVTPTDTLSPSRTWSDGTTSALVWASNLPIMSGGRWQISIGQLTLPGGEVVDLGGGSLTTLLLAGDGATTRLSSDSGAIKTLDDSNWPVERGTAAALEAGQGAMVEKARSVELSNSGETDETVWVVALGLTGAEPTPVGSPVAEIGVP